MKTAKQAQRDAKRLFRLCFTNGSFDERRVRTIVARLVSLGPGTLSVLGRFQRLVRLDRTMHSATVTSAAPLPAEIRSQLETGVTRVYGPGITTSFAEDPALLGGLRLTVGSDVYDGTIQGRLSALAERF
jgi:F-type H+-transporting ATPase subunit delta